MTSTDRPDAPAADAQSTVGVATDAGSDRATIARGLGVLIVEDHDFQRRMAVRLVRSLGAQRIHEAADGGVALTQLQRAPDDAVDLVICDLDMPKMDGMEFLRHLGRTHPDVSVIILSAQSDALMNSVEKMARAYGVRLLGVIEKPASVDRLTGLIAELRASNPSQPGRPAGAAPEFELEEINEGIRLGQMEAHFQTQIEIASGRIVGAEALARWRHPEAGLIGPGAFVPKLERAHAIDRLTFLMLEQAAVAGRACRERGVDLSMSVNLSLASLTETTLADRITATVRDAGFDARRIILEITETAAMTDVAPALENLARLRMRGFGLSIDDYGTGFSSMQQLTRVPFTELKIDRGFVAGVAHKHQARVIVESSIEVARKLGIRSLAEGVETAADLATLKSLGCDLAQGYFFARPAELDAFVKHCLGGPA